MKALPELPGVEHRFHEVRGFRMHVAEAGEGEPVVLLHGWPQHWWCWRKQIPVLADAGYRVIVPDLRGYGWSEAPPSGYEKESFADDIAALLDLLELDQVRLVGHDWGGMAGFILAVKRPDLVQRYLALNTGHLWGKVDLRGMMQLWRFWYAAVMATPLLGRLAVRSTPAFFDAMRRILEATPEAWSDEDAALYTDQWREPERAHVSVLTYRTFMTREQLDYARNRWQGRPLRVPTLLLHGTDDGVIHPLFLRGLEENADDARIEFVDGCGHFIAEQCPARVNERMLEFFDLQAR